MKFASLLKQHSNNRVSEQIKPITINCNKNKILLNLANHKYIENNEDSQSY
jgi:hypothetical protein